MGRDIHKMHAFVRFRFVGTHATTGREQFVGWFEPAYPIVRLAAPFFQKRFTGLDWSILTPHECVHWDGVMLHFTPGVPRRAAPDEDALDDLWRSYYRSIFNPARLKVKAMQAWKYAGDFEAGLVANTNLGGDNCHRGAVLGAMLGAAAGTGQIPARFCDGLHDAAVLRRQMEELAPSP